MVNGVGSMIRSSGRKARSWWSSASGAREKPELTRANTNSSERRSRLLVSPPAKLPPGPASDDGVDAAMWASNDSNVAFKCALVMMPTQESPSRTGKSVLDSSRVASNAASTSCTEAWGRNFACSGRTSINSKAKLPSKLRGTSPSKNGRPLRSICSSSWPFSFIFRFTARATETLSMTTGVMLKSLTHWTTINTTAAAICLKPQSMAEAPTTAYTPLTAVTRPTSRSRAPVQRPNRPPNNMVAVKAPPGTGKPAKPTLRAK
mmetsp:Transcript_4931/g.14828  ORF Transcript_4931/g.14828 Transcript_4931/m.14828 type:complete len:262 (+) Transcript_4931:216-1001(+)